VLRRSNELGLDGPAATKATISGGVDDWDLDSVEVDSAAQVVGEGNLARCAGAVEFEDAAKSASLVEVPGICAPQATTQELFAAAMVGVVLAAVNWPPRWW